jgi:hypothetical protein
VKLRCNLRLPIPYSCCEMREEKTMTNGPTMHTLPGSSQFPTTRWTLVVAAGDPHRKEARSALVSLCENYWYPLYAYLRRRGYSADQAQDLTQEFFTRVLEGRYLDRADPEKGRFRSFLLTSLKFFAAGQFCHWKSPQARIATNANLHTTKPRSGSSSGAGRWRCSIESWRNCGTSSCSTAARSISTG